MNLQPVGGQDLAAMQHDRRREGHALRQQRIFGQGIRKIVHVALETVERGPDIGAVDVAASLRRIPGDPRRAGEPGEDAVAHGVALCGNALLALNFLRLFFTKPATATVGRAAMEASAS